MISSCTICHADKTIPVILIQKVFYVSKGHTSWKSFPSAIASASLRAANPRLEYWKDSPMSEGS